MDVGGGKTEAILRQALGVLFDQLLAEQTHRARWLQLQPLAVEGALQAAQVAAGRGQTFRTALKEHLDALAGLQQGSTSSHRPEAASSEESRVRAESMQAATAASEAAYDQALADGLSQEEAGVAATAAYQATLETARAPGAGRQNSGVRRSDSSPYNNSHPPEDARDMNLRGPGMQAIPHVSSSAPSFELGLEPQEATSDHEYINHTWLQELDARANRPHTHYSTGIGPLDELLGGGYVEGLHVIGGITGGGKTSFALSIALHNALAGRDVIYATYEQSRLELWARLAAGLTNVPYGAIKRGVYHRSGERILASQELTASDAWADVEAAAKHLLIVEGGDSLSRTNSAYSVEALVDIAEQITAKHGTPPLVIVDYLQRMPAPREIRDARERLGYAAGQLQVQLGRGLGCPVIALSSLNRASYRLASLELEERLAGLKEAGEIEYTAYTATLLYGLPGNKQGPKMSPGALNGFNPMTVDVVKHREGRPGRVAVKWAAGKDRWYDAMPYGTDNTAL